MKTQSDVIVALVESLEILLDYGFEDSDVTEVEYEKAKKRFHRAFYFIVDSFVDQSLFTKGLTPTKEFVDVKED